MPSSSPQQALSETLTKREAVEYLGRSVRTIESWVASGRLPCEYLQGKFGKVTMFRREAVEALKRDLDTPIVQMRRVSPTNGVPAHLQDLVESRAAIARVAAPDPFAGLAAHLAKLASAFPSPQRVKPWLTLNEAAEYSGLPKAWLRMQTRREFRPDGQPNVARNFGSEKRAAWRFSRDLLRK